MALLAIAKTAISRQIFPIQGAGQRGPPGCEPRAGEANGGHGGRSAMLSSSDLFLIRDTRGTRRFCPARAWRPLLFGHRRRPLSVLIEPCELLFDVISAAADLEQGIADILGTNGVARKSATLRTSGCRARCESRCCRR